MSSTIQPYPQQQYSPQPYPQQQYYQQPPQKTQQQLEIEQYYNQIYTKLAELFSTNSNIDPYSLKKFIASNNMSISKERMGDFFKHLLFYTYASTAAEISNHQEINKQLEEIKKTLSKLIKEEPVVDPTATTTAPA